MTTTLETLETPGTQPATPPQEQALAGTKRRPLGAILAAVGIPMFMVTLDNLVVTNALPVIKTELGASLTDLQWFVNAYTLSFATLLLTAAAIGDAVRDRYGRIYRLIRDLTGASAEDAERFLSVGMLLTVMAAMRVVGADPVPADWATEITDALAARRARNASGWDLGAPVGPATASG